MDNAHDRAASRDEHLLRLTEALELGGYAPRIHVVVGEQLRALIVLLAPLATASRSVFFFLDVAIRNSLRSNNKIQ